MKSLIHDSEILASFRLPGEVRRFRDVISPTGFNKGMCYRLLYTLHQCGFVEKLGETTGDEPPFSSSKSTAFIE